MSTGNRAFSGIKPVDFSAFFRYNEAMKAKSAVLTAFFLCIPVLFAGCYGTTDYRSETFFRFGTSVRLIVVHPQDTYGEMIGRIDAFLTEVEDAASVERENSDIARFNELPAGGSTEISRTAAEIIEKAREAYALTDGAFNPAVYLLVDLWGFSPRVQKKDFQPTRPYDRTPADSYYPLPDERYVEAFRSLSDFSAVSLTEEAGKYFLTKNAPAVTVDGTEYVQQLDLSGIAKGYAADGIRAILSEYGVTEGYLNFGTSSVLLLNGADGTPWNLGIQHPRKESDFLSLPIENKSVSTSGDYQNCYEIDGVRYCHAIDPATGNPAEQSTLSVSVFTDDGALADALSTACLVRGEAWSVRLLDSLDCSYAIVTQSGDNLKLTTNLENYQLLDKEIAVA